MLIRQAKEGDIDQLIELCGLHAAYEKSKFDPNGKKEKLLSHFFHGPSGIQCIIVESQEKLLGYATFIRQFSTWDAAYYVYLDCLYLREEIRGQGIGKKLMEKVKMYADREQCSHVQWQTPSFNKPAIEFYKGLGAYSKTKERFFWK